MGSVRLEACPELGSRRLFSGIRALPSSSQNERLHKKCFCKILQGTNANFNGIWLVSEYFDEIETLNITLGYEIGASDKLRLNILNEVTRVRELARDDPACLARKREKKKGKRGKRKSSRHENQRL